MSTKRKTCLIAAAALLLVAMAGVPVGASASRITPIGQQVQTAPQSVVTVQGFPQQASMVLSDDIRTRWSLAVFHAVGNLNPTPGMVQVGVEWSLSEDGGTDAIRRNNQYNTTLCLPGKMTGAINGDGACGVQGYATFEDGVVATVATINQSNMRGIRDAMLGNDPDALRRAIWESPWAASRYGNGSAWVYVK